MRSRNWQEWLIVLGIVAIGVTGVLTLWGHDLFYTDEKPAKLDIVVNGKPEDGLKPPATPSQKPAAPVVPGGPSQGPF